jgi:hypothetical protein
MEMTQWEALAQSLGFPGEVEMWKELYEKRKLSISQLSLKFACSPHTVRSRLKSLQLEIRKRGGPNSVKVQVTNDLLLKIKQQGIPTTAKQLGVSPQALYSRLYYSLGIKKKDLEKELTKALEDTSPEEAPVTDPI